MHSSFGLEAGKTGAALACALAAWLLQHPARAQTEQPWLERPARAPAVAELGDYDLVLEAEYRASALAVHALSLNDQGPHDATWMQHRLRLGAEIGYEERVRLVVSAEALDGTLWRYGNAFARDQGSAAETPSTIDAVYSGAGNPAFPTSYALGLAPARSALRRAYGELLTDLGMLRVGRQAVLDGESIYAASGHGRSNRFGPTGAGDSVDRVLFVTKPLAAFGPALERDRSRERGLFVGVFYDRLADDDPQAFDDELHGAGLAVRWLSPDPAQRRHADLLAVVAQRWEADLDTSITLLGLRGMTSLYRLSAGMELVIETGETRARATGPALPGEDRSSQRVRRIGSRGVARWDEPAWTAYLELDFASGDSSFDPEDGLTDFRFSPDTNVGLIMFERIMAYESARSARAGSFGIEQAGGSPGAADWVATHGAFTNALAIFPQLDLRVSEALTLRAGVLWAWAPARLVDPVRSGFGNLAARNFHGGRARQFYGTEVDLRVTWNALERFFLDLEGGVLFPGAALEDLQGNAHVSELAELTATFAF